MYSGQEIVSQEECKIVLAEFYEGVKCYNQVDRTIKFQLLDWSTATYDSNTKTLETRNFSCRPVIIDEIKITFEASLPAATTGLEVHMHTESYERTRIMPLIYLPDCSVLSWDWPYQHGLQHDWAYIETFCNLATETTVELYGEIDTISNTKITAVGYQDSAQKEPLHLEFLDEAGVVMTITPVITTEDRETTDWEYNTITQEYEQITVTKEIILISVGLATSIRFTGLFEYDALIYSCTFSIGEITSFCNLSNPFETRITASTDTYEELPDGWFKLSSTTEFKLSPTHEFLRKDDSFYYFTGADKIEFRYPMQLSYDIFLCWDDDLVSTDYFYIYPNLDYDVDLDKWFLNIYLNGDYDISGNTIIDLNTSDIYYFYTNQGIPINLTGLICEDGVCTIEIFGACGAYYILNSNAPEDILTSTMPMSTDYRTVWDDIKCKYIVTCESIGYLPCPCMICEDNDDGETVHIYSSNTITETCTSEGLKNTRQVASACEGGLYLSLGNYPSLTLVSSGTPAATTAKTDFVYFKGTSMYIKLLSPALVSYYAFIGNLNWGVTLKTVYDEITDTHKQVNFLPFAYMSIFNIPFKYVASWGLYQSLWSDSTIWSSGWDRFWCEDPSEWDLPCFGWEVPPCEKNWPPSSFCENPDYGKTDQELAMAGLFPPGDGQFDFKITLSELIKRIPSEWNSNFSWTSACSWISAETKRISKKTDLNIGVNNTADLDLVSCEDDVKTKYYTSNIPLTQGSGVIAPAEAEGTCQIAYDEYVQAIKLLSSPASQVYALYGGTYNQGGEL